MHQPADIPATLASPGPDSAFAHRIDAAVERAADTVDAMWGEFAQEIGPVAPSVAAWVELARSQTGGGFLRARLVAASYYGSGGESDEVCDALTASVQLLHLGLCIHDDLIDGDEHRHGRANVSGVVRAQLESAGYARVAVDRHAVSAALLAGDLAIELAHRALLAAPVADRIRILLLEAMGEARRFTIIGEQLDVTNELLTPEFSRPILAAELKTARYSFILPLHLGALAGADTLSSPVLATLEACGQSMGIAYQLIDDDLGVFGDPSRTGKSTRADLRAGKRTELLRLTYANASPAQRRLLDAGVGRWALTDAEAKQLRKVMAATGARQSNAQLAQRCAASAARTLRSGPLRTDLTDYLLDLVHDFLMARVEVRPPDEPRRVDSRTGSSELTHSPSAVAGNGANET